MAVFRGKKTDSDGKNGKPSQKQRSFSTVMPITEGMAAWAKVLGKRNTYAPEQSQGMVNELSAAGSVLQYELGYDSGVAPTPFGTSSPDGTHSQHDVPQMRADAQKNPNKQLDTRLGPGGVKEVRLKPNASNAYFLEGKINGHSVSFLVDTGASSVSIPGRIANLLKLEKEGRVHQAQTANGIVNVYDTLLDSVTLGNIELNWVKGSVNPSDNSNDILLGMSALSRLEFTYADGELILRQHAGE